ncbi:hypothetical protein SDJN02_01549, partial [Cucurbita argyrosperma subsp. argyrosperma]
MGSIADHGPFTGLTLWVHEEKFWPKKAGAKSSMVLRVQRHNQHPRQFSQKLRHISSGEITNGGNQLPPQCPIGPLQSSGTVLRLL